MKNEIESLNLNAMDVEELERRIELGQMMPIIVDIQDCKPNCEMFNYS